MKKKRIIGLLTLAPLCLLAACSGGTPALTLTANWYRNTAISDGITGTHERLEYKVEFIEPTTKSDFTVTYETGKYITELKSETRALANGESEMVYVYTTSLSLRGYYTVAGDRGDTFEDSVETEVVFRNIKEQLQPVKSSRIEKTTAPISISPSSIQTASVEYFFSYQTTYAHDLSKATVFYTDLNDPAESAVDKKEIALSGTGTFLDNEEILFALRGGALSSSLTFRSINSVQRKCTTVGTTAGESADVLLKNVTIDGNASAELTVPALRVSLAYKDGQSGGAQTLWYAKTVDGNSNTYRNALVCMETEIFYGMGVLRYTLTDAQFTDK